MRGILISTLNTSIYERAYERDSHKHANTSIYERADERNSYKHANTSIHERAYERDPHKHDNQGRTETGGVGGVKPPRFFQNGR